jgi:hypothetical protein
VELLKRKNWDDLSFEEVEADYIGISVEALREIRKPLRKFRNYAKRMKGNKYVKFTEPF